MQRSYRMVLAVSFLAVTVVAATAEARGGRGGGGGGRAFAGGGGDRAGAGRDFNGGGRGDLGGLSDRGLGGAGLGDSRLGGVGAGGVGDLGARDLGAGDRIGDGARPLANGPEGTRQLQQFLGLPSEGGRLDGALDDRGDLRGDAAGARRDFLNQRSGELQQHAQNWINGFHGGDAPFSAGWYADHPQAWQDTHPNADVWAAASLGATAAWIGATAFNGVDSYADPYAETADAVTDDSTALTTESTTANESDSTAETIQPGSSVAANPTNPAAGDGQWLSLGVYALEPPQSAQKELMQLAVSKAGEIKGVYYNADDGSAENIAGQIDRTTQVAKWQVISTPELTFSAPLKTLTSPTGDVTATTAAGEQQTWLTARLQQPQPAAQQAEQGTLNQ